MMRALYVAAMRPLLESAGIKFFDPIELCDVGRTAKHGDKIVRLEAPPARMFRNILPTVEVADWLREEFGPLVVNSGYRDPLYNEAAGGEPHSLHLAFNALDLRSVDGATPEQMAAYLETHRFARMMGIGLYGPGYTAGPAFLHLDTRGLLNRPAPARWPTRDRAKLAA